MAIADDFTVALNGDIRYVGGGSTYYTVLELHRFLQALADDEVASGNDLVDITSLSPSFRFTDQIIQLNSPYNIDDDAAEQLYGGSISQDDGNTLYAGLAVVGTVETGTQLMIFRNNSLLTSWWSTGINPDIDKGIFCQVIIKIKENGVLIDGGRLRVQAREFNDTYAEFSVLAGEGNSVAAIFTYADGNNETAQATVAAWDCSNTEGYQMINYNNGNGDTPYYSKWDLGTQSDINDLYEFTKNIQRRGSSETIHSMNGQYFRGINLEFGYDAESGNFSEDEIIAWGCSFTFGSADGDFTIGERLDFGTSNAVAILIAQDDNGTSGTMYVQVISGTPANGNGITGFTSGKTASVTSAPANITANAGTAALLALDDNGTTGTMWVQILTGLAPVDDLPIYGTTTEQTCAVAGTPTARTITPEFIGKSTGTSLESSFGVGVDPNDVSSADKLRNLLNVVQTPPNNQTYYVYGLASGEDRILVATNDGSDWIDYDQMSLSVALTTAAETQATMSSAIPSNSPATGTIRIELDNPAVYKRVAYSSWSGSVFTFSSSEDFSGNNASSTNNVFVSFIDKDAAAGTESFTSVYGGDFDIVILTRDGKASPIKPDLKLGTFGAGGGSVTVTRTSDE